jgi:hypothetical protein
MEGEYIGYGVGAVGIIAGVAQLAWSRFFGDGQAHAGLVDHLTARLASLETRQAELERRVTEEMTLRLAAQEEVFNLRVRLRACEAEIARLGGEVPDVNMKAGGTD